MSSPLLRCIEKINRADEHIRCLHERTQKWLDTPAYEISADMNYYAGEIVLRAHVRREPPSVELGVIIGDVTHNLRSALDNLVWGLTEINLSVCIPKFPPVRSAWRDIAFPIFVSPKKYAPKVNAGKHSKPMGAAKMLWGVKSHLHARFKELQPFCTRPDDPEREPLAVLHELWNGDKHRHPALVNFFLSLAGVHSKWPFPSEKPDWWIREFEIISQRPPGPFEDGAEIGRVRPGGSVISSLPQVEMDPQLSFDVAFEEGPPAYGEPVLRRLTELSQTVRAIIIQFEPEFP